MRKYMLGRKNIGTLVGDTFSKEVQASRHLFRVLDAFGVDSETLNKLPPKTKIKIYDTENHTTYQTTKEEFQEKGQYYHFKQPRADHRTQLFLRRSEFNVTKKSKEELEREEFLKFFG